ncbi:MAG: hypothetical protein LQ352_001831 [Teloschistes flavicans]|nr:MAG: hypothetical protein LQ352_001831 [Teloschistes flavicans]
MAVEPRDVVYAIVLGDYIYIDGGEAALGQQPYPANGSMPNPTYDPVGLNVTLSLPLAESWTPDKVRFNVIIKPGMPLWNFQSLWHDATDDSLWAFGGEISLLGSLNPDLGIWNFKLNGGGGGTWTQKSNFRGAPWNQNITRPLGGAGRSTNSTGFLLGGYSSARSSPFTGDLAGFVPTPGLLTYSFDNGTWANVTDTPNLSSSGAVEWPGMELVPFGPNGLMVVIGGETSDLTSYTPGGEERSMTEITLFDPVTLRFYKQTATGDEVPSQRNRFCTASVGDDSKNTDGSPSGSYEIYVYGGYGGNLGAGAEQYDEIWALTLPAFQWIKVDASHNSARIGHTCHIVGKSQLLSIGGADAAQSDPWSTVDPAFQGLGTFDLNNWNWTNGYDANAAPYKRADPLVKLYQSNGQYPKTWDMPELEALILNKALAPSTSSTSGPSSSNTSVSTSPDHSHHGLSKYEKIGIGVGSSIGGIIALLLFGAIFYHCIRRKRRSTSYYDNNKNHNNSNELPGESSKHELPPQPRLGRKPPAKRFVVELDAGEVAAEKAVGTITPGQRSPGLHSPVLINKWGSDPSLTSSGNSTSSPPPFKPEYKIYPDPRPPPPPPKLMISPPSVRVPDRRTGNREHQHSYQ